MSASVQEKSAKEAFRSGDYARAVEHCDAGLSLRADDWGLSFLKGVSLYRARRFDDALVLFLKLCRRNERHAESRFYLGLCFEKTGEIEDAARELASALALKPDLVEARRKLDEIAPRRGAPPALAPSAEPVAPGAELRPHAPVALEHPRTLARTLAELVEDPARAKAEGTGGRHLFTRRRKIRSYPLSLLLASVFFLMAYFREWPTYYFVEELIYFQRSWIVYVSSQSLALIGVALLILTFIRAKSTSYAFYEFRIDLESGILSRRHETIYISDIENVTFRAPFLLTLFWTGVMDLSVRRSGVADQARGTSADGAATVRIIGLGSGWFMSRIRRELLDAAVVERRAMKKWWI